MDCNRDLGRVRWIGGSAGAGKSTVAKRLAEASGLRVYHCDRHFEEHRQRADPMRHSRFLRLADRPVAELWTQLPSDLALELRGFYEEEFEMVLEDLRRLAVRGPVLAEGAGLLPSLVEAAGGRPLRAVWLVATPQFRRRQHAHSETYVSLLRQCSDPEKAYSNWMERDDHFAAWIVREADRVHQWVLKVDGGRTVEETVAEVAGHLCLTSESS